MWTFKPCSSHLRNVNDLTSWSRLKNSQIMRQQVQLSLGVFVKLSRWAVGVLTGPQFLLTKQRASMHCVAQRLFVFEVVSSIH